MRRWQQKPNQEIYRPGSGPLRKSQQIDDIEENNPRKPSIQDRLKRHEDTTQNRQNNSQNDQKRQKKPEQQIYIAKGMEKVMTDRQENFRKNKSENWNRNDRPKSSRAFSRNDYHNGNMNQDRPKNYDRDMRQGSEPRNIRPHTVHSERIRDTRSVEPGGPKNEKIQSKPPSGRRHSIGIEENTGKLPKNIENLPPRFRKQFLQNANRIEQNNQIPPVPEDNWDGNSLTFKNCGNYNSNFQNNRPQGPVPSYYQNYNPRPNQPLNWSNTLPNQRPRGRGRLRQEIYDSYNVNQNNCRSPTFSNNSRPSTPLQNSVENVSQPNSRCQTPVDYQRPVSSFNNKIDRNDENYERENRERDRKTHDDPDEILDWSEEVELNALLEAEIMSDSNTRCSSPGSLMEENQAPQQSQPTQKSGRNRNRKRRGNRSRSISCSRRGEKQPIDVQRNIQTANPEKSGRRGNRQNSRDGNRGNRDRDNRDADGFRIPESRHGRRNSFRDRSNDRYNNSRQSSVERVRRNSTEVENWREEIRLRRDSERQREEMLTQNNPSKNETTNPNAKPIQPIQANQNIDEPKNAPGIIILPPKTPPKNIPPVLKSTELPTIKLSGGLSPQQKTLFDPNNPNKPIIVTSNSSRAPVDLNQGHPSQTDFQNNAENVNNFGPVWYNPNSENFCSCRYPKLIEQIEKADVALNYFINTGTLLQNWSNYVSEYRQFLHSSLEFLIINDIKFCQMENVENHFWRILYYNIIELIRKSDSKDHLKSFTLSLIDEGTKYFEHLLEILENSYKFKLDNFLGSNNIPPQKNLNFVGLALVSAQKIFLFLGDLARYKEQVNETSNYAKCKQWYIKAQEVNPKNGRPYNQLALLSIYARRKLDAVYFYMRSLMSSNPVQSAKESLLSLFDENRKKYEQSEKKRRDERSKLQMKEKETAKRGPSSLRKEIWVHPDGGRRVHRTTTAEEDKMDSEEEDLRILSSVEVNKRFITSYLHVHGKLITKIGMETFQDAAVQMLKEFRILLEKSPIPMNTNRFLQLLALNMFAIESTQLKGPKLDSNHRSEPQERALIVSLLMFNIILERCVELTRRELDRENPNLICQDLQVVLPAVKTWCDWMLCHSSIWNPPPSTSDYRIGVSGDTWEMLAILMNNLEKLDYPKPVLENELREGLTMVRLPEDATMYGFAPLMLNIQEPMYVQSTEDRELAQMCFRISRVLFFGTVFLCGCEPPVLKLLRRDESAEYISVVADDKNDSECPGTPPRLHCDAGDVLVESFSGDEDEDVVVESTTDPSSSNEVQSLLDRKVELEKQKRDQELHKQQVQAILQQSVISVEIEIRPKYLVPDTNCFIDYLTQIQNLAKLHPNPYTVMIPLVVLGELEGLSRGGKSPLPPPRTSLSPQHLVKVAEASKNALEFLRSKPHNVKCVTTKGTVLVTSAFTSEDDKDQNVGPRNDDRILATCLSLCKDVPRSPEVVSESTSSNPRRLFRETVLLTEDRNLRVKALARDVPVRELPDFLRWAGLG